MAGMISEWVSEQFWLLYGGGIEHPFDRPVITRRMLANALAAGPSAISLQPPMGRASRSEHQSG